ncbi:MAG: rod shape-determining protein MreC [Acidimicrobiales bacterium]
MATERSRRRTWTLGAAVLATLVVLYLTTGVASGLRSGANLVITPFSWAVNEIARPVGHFFAGTVNYSDVVAQNQKLRYQLGVAEERANEGWAFARQLQQLTTELDVPFVGSLPTVAAQVTTLSPTNFAATVGISKGGDSGIMVGMPVVANGGLVGSVIDTTPHGATVRLITDTASLVGVTFKSGKTDIVVSGRGLNNGLSATSVPLGTSIEPGTRLETDGLNGALYPAGLPVATVKTVTLTPGAATYNLTLKPVANLRHLSYLDVVLWEPTA